MLIDIVLSDYNYDLSFVVTFDLASCKKCVTFYVSVYTFSIEIILVRFLEVSRVARDEAWILNNLLC